MGSSLFGSFALPIPGNVITSDDIATTLATGVVKSTAAATSNANMITVAVDGTMKVHNINPETLTGAALDSLKLGGVNATDILVASGSGNSAKVKNAAAADALASAISFTVGTSDGDGYGTVNNQSLNANVSIPFALKTQSVTTGTYTKVTVNSKGIVTAATTLNATDIPTLTLSKISDAGTMAGKNKVAESDFDSSLTSRVAVWDTVTNKADAATTLAGYGITDAYTKTEVDGLISSALHYKGTYTTFAELVADVADGTINPIDGDVYNITTAGGTDSSGIPIKAGDNVAAHNCTTSGGITTCNWDVLGGMVDLSAYLTIASAEATYATITDFEALNEEVMGSDGTGTTSGIKATVTKLDANDSTTGSVRNLIKTAKTELEGELSTHNEASTAHDNRFVTKQNKVLNIAVVFATSDFTVNNDSSIPAAFVGSKTVSGLTASNDYVAALSSAPESLAAVRDSKFLPINKLNAGVLYVYCNVMPSTSITLNGVYTQIQ